MSNFQPLVRDVGSRHWLCPKCGHWQRTRMVPGRYRFKCKGCERIWIIGYNFYRAPKGPGRLPLDMIYPDWDNAPVPAFIGGRERGQAPRERLNTVEEGDEVGEGGPSP